MEQTLFVKYDAFFNKSLCGVTNAHFDENAFL